MNKKTLEIFKVFFIIGIQLLGGGYVIVPLLKKYVVDDKKWMTEEELVNFFAMSQCIPGIIAGNISVCAGYRANGIMGAIAAILGIIIAPFFFILVIASVLSNISNVEIVQNAFMGIRVSVIVLILVTIKDLWKNSVNSVFTYVLFSIILIALIVLPVSPAIIIIFAGIVGLFYGKLKGVKND